MNTFGRLGLCVGVLILGGCSAPPPSQPPAPADTRAADEAAIHAAVKEWSAAAQSKDAEKFASYYADDAVLMLEDAPDVRGKAAIHDAVMGMMQDPNFALSFEADKVVAARSGDLAYESGTYSLTMSNPDKAPATEHGHYVVVWQKEADGTWKAVRDAPVSDPSTDAPQK